MGSRKSNRAGEIISHLSMALMGLAMLYGGYKCLSAAHRISIDFERQQMSLYGPHYWRQDHGGSGALLPGSIGIVLVLIGAVLCLAACVPVSTLERMFAPPAASLGEEPSGSWISSLSWIFFWW